MLSRSQTNYVKYEYDYNHRRDMNAFELHALHKNRGQINFGCVNDLNACKKHYINVNGKELKSEIYENVGVLPTTLNNGKNYFYLELKHEDKTTKEKGCPVFLEEVNLMVTTTEIPKENLSGDTVSNRYVGFIEYNSVRCKVINIYQVIKENVDFFMVGEEEKIFIPDFDGEPEPTEDWNEEDEDRGWRTCYGIPCKCPDGTIFYRKVKRTFVSEASFPDNFNPNNP